MNALSEFEKIIHEDLEEWTKTRLEQMILHYGWTEEDLFGEEDEEDD